MNSGFGQSCRGYFLLTFLGYPKIRVLHGGIDAWAAAGLAMSKETPTPKPASFPVDHAAAGIIIDASEMLAAIGNPAIAKLDVLDVDEWIGESSSPYGKDFCPRKGRIPGARLSLLLQGRARVEHAAGAQGGRREGRENVFRLVE